MKINEYFQIFNDYQKMYKMNLMVEVGPESIKIEDIDFYPVSRNAVRSEMFQGQGVLVPQLDENQKKFCEKNRISYFTKDGYFFLAGKKRAFKLMPVTIERKKRQRSPQLNSSLFISRNGFAILDTIFKVADFELQENRSVLRFADRYRLSQPQISKMMTALNAHTLFDLQKALRKLEPEWWRVKLTSPMTRTLITPFVNVQQPFYSLDENEIDHKINTRGVWEKFKCKPGPMELAKEMGLILEDNVYLWGHKESLKDLKREYRLVPGKSSSGRTWYIAEIEKSFQEEIIESRVHGSDPVYSLNQFRAIWDLGFYRDRVPEVIGEIIYRVIYEI